MKVVAPADFHQISAGVDDTGGSDVWTLRRRGGGLGLLVTAGQRPCHGAEQCGSEYAGNRGGICNATGLHVSLPGFGPTARTTRARRDFAHRETPQQEIAYRKV